jgi:hypothetical protein
MTATTAEQQLDWMVLQKYNFVVELHDICPVCHADLDAPGAAREQSGAYVCANCELCVLQKYSISNDTDDLYPRQFGDDNNNTKNNSSW